MVSGLEPALVLLGEDRRRLPAGTAPVLLSPGAPTAVGRAHLTPACSLGVPHGGRTLHVGPQGLEGTQSSLSLA